MTKMQVIKCAETTQPIEAPAFGEWSKTSRNNAWRAPIKDMIVTTPVFGRVQLRKFEKKNDLESDAIVAYFTLMHEDEDTFMKNVLEVVEKAVREEVKNNAKDLFGKKGMKDTLFKSGINDNTEFTPSFRSNLVLDSKNGQPINCEFYTADGSRMSFEELTENVPLGTSFSARAYIQFTHAYALNNNNYGYKSCVRLLQLMSKPASVPVVNDLKEGSGVDTTPLGLGAFE